MADAELPQAPETPLRHAAPVDASDLHEVALDEAAAAEPSRGAPAASSDTTAGAALAALLADGHSASRDEAVAPPHQQSPPHGAVAAPAAGSEAAQLAGGDSSRPATPPLQLRPTSQRVALFDLDLTLLDVNTGRLWVEKEFRQGKVPFGLYLLSVYWFAKYAAGLGIDSSEVAREAMGHYKGDSDAAMTAEVEAFWGEECGHRLRPGAAAALAAHRAAGDRVVLCTASWQHIAAAARRSFAMDGAICSVIEVGPDGRFTGGVLDAYGDGKRRRTLEWAAAEGIDLGQCTFYTDSYSDLPLMHAVGHPVAVCPDSRLADAARKAGWRIEDWGHAPQTPHTAKHRYQCSILGITNGCM